MRRLRPDGNPLRRTVDRVEAAVMAGLLVAFLAGVPLAALAVAGQVAAGGMRAQRAQARWHQVPAVLLQGAPEPERARFEASLEPLVRARWTAPGGTRRYGEVYAPGGASAGTTIMVWTDRSGRLEPAPVQGADVVAQEAFAALAAAVITAAAVALTGLLVRRHLDRRRLAAWDAEWSRAGPQWTGRL